MGELLDLAERAIAGADVAEEVEAYAVHKVATTVQAGTGGVVRTVGRAETRGVGIRVIAGARTGYASTADVTPAGLSAALERARANALVADRDEAVQLPRAEAASPADDFWGDSAARTSLAAKLELAAALARRVTDLDSRVDSIDTAEFHDEQILVALASSRGIRVEHGRAFAELSSDAVGAADGQASDYAYWCGRDVADIDLDGLAREAVDRTTRLLGVPVTWSGRGSVVLDRAVVGTFLAAIGRACSGGALSTGRSVFARSYGSQVGDPVVHLADDGLSQRAPNAARYDDEGVPRRRTTLIEGGTLVGALHTATTARAMGRDARTTGNAARATHKTTPRAAATALVLEPTGTLSHLLEAAGEATYLQQLSGSQSGVSSVTGRVNVGGVGFLLRAGEPAGRLPTVPVATTLQRFLSSIQMVADDHHAVPGLPVVAPTVLCSSQLLMAET